MCCGNHDPDDFAEVRDILENNDIAFDNMAARTFDGKRGRMMAKKIAQKIVNTTEAIDLDIKGITLLSIEEYEHCRDNIKPIPFTWWLRSPGYYNNLATVVFIDGDVSNLGRDVDDSCGVRPALKINLESSNLRIGDKIEWENHSWTVISDNLMLCDGIIAELPFRKDWHADDANEYEKSDVKKWLENWLAEQMESEE